MHSLYLLSVWFHILAATIWIGGMFFIVLVVVPWLRHGGDRQSAGAFLRETGERFRGVGWVCFGIIIVTGTFNLWIRGVHLSDFGRWEWISSSFGTLVMTKLTAFALVLGVSAVHDFSVGPRATRAIERDPQSKETQRLRRQASLLGRANALLALVLVAVGVMLVRGAFW